MSRWSWLTEVLSKGSYNLTKLQIIRSGCSSLNSNTNCNYVAVTTQGIHTLIPFSPSVSLESVQDLRSTGPQCCSSVTTHQARVPAEQRRWPDHMEWHWSLSKYKCFHVGQIQDKTRTDLLQDSSSNSRQRGQVIYMDVLKTWTGILVAFLYNNKQSFVIYPYMCRCDIIYKYS